MLVRVARHLAPLIAARIRLFLPVLLLTILGAPQTGVAQTPTAEQLEIFQDLPADQQQAILDTLGSGSGSATSGARTDRQVRFPNTVRPRTVDGRGGLESLFGEQQEPRLKGEDTLLLSLEIRELTGPDVVTPTTTVVPSGQLLPQQAGSTGQAPATEDLVNTDQPGATGEDRAHA